MDDTTNIHADEWATLLSSSAPIPTLDDEPDAAPVALPATVAQTDAAIREIEYQMVGLESDDERFLILVRERMRLTDHRAVLVAEAARAELTATRYVVTYGGVEHFIEEPDIDDITALCRLIGDKGGTAGRIVGQQLKGLFMEVVKGKPQSAIPVEQLAFGFLSGLESKDIVKLGIILLYGGSDEKKREGAAFFNRLDRKQIKIDPLITAFAYRVAQSEDLRSALKRLPLVQAAFSA